MVFKALDVVGLFWLTCLCSVTWKRGAVPLDWQTGMLGPIFKQWDWRQCSQVQPQWDGLHQAKGKKSLSVSRIRIQAEKHSFRPGHRMQDQLFILLRILKCVWKQGDRSTCMLWTWRRHSSMSLWAFCLRCFRSMECPACCYEPFSPCTAIELGSHCESDSFLVGSRLHLLIKIVMDRISRQSQVSMKQHQ